MAIEKKRLVKVYIGTEWSERCIVYLAAHPFVLFIIGSTRAVDGVLLYFWIVYIALQ